MKQDGDVSEAASRARACLSGQQQQGVGFLQEASCSLFRFGKARSGLFSTSTLAGLVDKASRQMQKIMRYSKHERASDILLPCRVEHTHIPPESKVIYFIWTTA